MVEWGRGYDGATQAGTERGDAECEQDLEFYIEVGSKLIVQLFQRGFDGYMRYAYPAVSPTFNSSLCGNSADGQDELRPLTCTPLHRDPNPGNFGINDIHANVSMTLLDTLSSLPTIYPSALPAALHTVATKVSFDQDVKVQVFEMTIRAMGSLLSTYQYIDTLPPGPDSQAAVLGIEKTILGGKNVQEYKSRLLELALDLGKRLLPAFQTPTGLPYARVNLRYGVEKGESVETCMSYVKGRLMRKVQQEQGVLSWNLQC
jgi:mannosidase alpha-like ER degradation enhancer 1